ncbi:MAG: OmpA family protein [Terracidiphilus sp.]|nr:OmpA family protein [Terracidiphilus sp.]
MKTRPHRRPGNDRWMVSYADFVTLLFALFVVMYAVERADQKHRGDVSQSIDAAFRSLGIFPSSSRTLSRAEGSATEQSQIPMNIVMGEDVLAPAQVKQNLEHLQRELTQTLSNQVATHTVSIRMGRDGLVISLREAGFFASGSAEPKPQTAQTLAKIAETLAHAPYDLRIEGHTDNIPIHTAQFDSNWELSTARATHIARIFLALHAAPADRVSAAGYAEFHPVAPNDTEAGRALNRRVDLVVAPRSSIDLSTPSSTPAASSNSATWKKITDGD